MLPARVERPAALIRAPEPREVIVVAGKTGSGKSHWSKECTKRWLSEGARVAVLDPPDEWSEFGRETPEVTLGPMTDRLTISELVSEEGSIFEEPELALAIVPDKWRRLDELGKQLDQLVDLLDRDGHPPLVLVLEEVSILTMARPDLLAILGTQHRHMGDGIALCLIGQRFVHAPPSARTQASRIRVFAQDQAEDIDALASRIRDRELAEQAETLERGQCIAWDDKMTGQAPRRKRAA